MLQPSALFLFSITAKTHSLDIFYTFALMVQYRFSPNISQICHLFFSAAFVCTPVVGVLPLAKIFRFSVLLLLLIVKQTQQQTSAEGGSGLNVKRPAVLMIKSQFEGKCSHSAALLSFSQLAAHQLYLCSCSLFSPEKEI